MVEKAYIILLIISNIISSFFVVKEYGEPILVFSRLLIMTAVLVFAYIFYRKTRKFGKKRKEVHLSINIERLNFFMFILVLTTLLYVMVTGMGRAESYRVLRGSQIFSLLNVNSVFDLYYIVGRRKKGKMYLINIFLYIMMRIIQGWTSIIFTVVIYELYFFCKDKSWYEKKISKTNIIITILVVLIFIFAGGIAYSVMQPVKSMIRGNIDDSSFSFLSIGEGIEKLIARYSYLPASVRSTIHHDDIIKLFSEQGNLSEIRSMLRPLVPRSFMRDKDFYSMGSSIAAGISGIYNINISESVGILYFAQLMISADMIQALFWLLIYVSSFLFIKKVMEMLENRSGEFNVLYFMVILSYIETGNIETLFTQKFFKLLFFLPLLWITGVVKITLKRTSYIEK